MKTLFKLIDTHPYIAGGLLVFVILYMIFLFVSINKVKENRDYYKPKKDW